MMNRSFQVGMELDKKDLQIKFRVLFCFVMCWIFVFVAVFWVMFVLLIDVVNVCMAEKQIYFSCECKEKVKKK